jgi:outer membrane protein insertion porin family
MNRSSLVFAVVFVLAGCHQQDQRVVTIVRPPQITMVEEVRIAGNRRIPTETIQAKIETKAGEPFNRVIINRDEDYLRSSGDFDDVRVTVEPGPNGGRIVTFNVREKRPIIP